MKSAKLLQKQLRELREECNVPQGDFADMLGISESHLCRLEKMDNVFSTTTLYNKLKTVVWPILNKDVELVFIFEGIGRSALPLSEAIKYVKNCRTGVNKTQAEYSLDMGLHTNTISRFERDQLRNLRTLAQIAEAHNATLEMEIYEAN